MKYRGIIQKILLTMLLTTLVATPINADQAAVSTATPQLPQSNNDHLFYQKHLLEKMITLYERILDQDNVSKEREVILEHNLKQVRNELKKVETKVIKQELTPKINKKIDAPLALISTLNTQPLTNQNKSAPAGAKRSILEKLKKLPKTSSRKYKITERFKTKKISRSVTPKKQEQINHHEQTSKDIEQALAKEEESIAGGPTIKDEQSINIPHFGTIEIQKIQKKFTSKIKAKFSKKSLDIGALLLDDINVKINQLDQLTITAFASIIGVGGKLTLQSQNDSFFMFKIELDQPISFLVTPTKEEFISELFLSLSPEGKKLFAKTNVFSTEKKNSIVTFDIEGESPHGTAKLAKTSTPDFLTQTKDRSLQITNCIVTLEEALSGKPAITVLEGSSKLKTFYPEASDIFRIGDNKVTLVLPDLNAFELLFSADAHYNNIPGELFLNKVAGNDRVFHFIPQEDIIFPFTILEEAFIDTVILEYKAGKLNFTATTPAFSKTGESTTIINLNPSSNTVNGTIDSIQQITLYELMDEAVTKSIIINKPTINIYNIFNPKKDPHVNIKGSTSLTKFLSSIPGKPKIDNVGITVTLDYEKGFQSSLQFTDQLTLIPDLCHIKKPTLHITRALGEQGNTTNATSSTGQTKQKTKSKGLLGKVTALADTVKKKVLGKGSAAKKALKIRKMSRVALNSEINITGLFQVGLNGIGKLSAQVSGPIIDGILQKFEGKIKENVDIAGKVKLGNTTLTYFVPEQIGRIAVTATIFKFEAIGAVEFQRVKKQQSTKNETHTVVSLRPKKKRFSPFEKTGVPGIKNIALSDLLIGYNITKRKFFMEGSAKIIKAEMRCRVEIGKVSKGANAGKKLIVLKVNLGENYKLSQTMSFLKGTPFDSLSFHQSSIIISSLKYYDEKYDARINKGFNFAARVKINSDPIKGITSIFKGLNPDLTVVGSIGSSIKDVRLKILIPLGLKFSDKAKLSKLGIELIGETLGVSLFGQMEVRPTSKDNPLFFTLRGTVTPIQALISASMEGFWNDPLGIKGFAVGNVAAEVGIDFPVFAATGLPSTFGITGSIKVGTIQATMATKISANLSEIILMTKLNRLGIRDIIGMVNTVGAKIPLNSVPDIGLKDVEMKFAPKGGRIGEIEFEQGITFKGKANIANQWALISINADMHGLVGKAGMSQLKLGPLLITGAGFDKKYGTKDDGPVISIALTMAKQEFFASGLMQFLGAKGNAEIYFRPTKYEFLTDIKLFNLFEARMQGYSKIAKKPDFWIKGTLKNDFYNFIRKEVTAGINKYEKEASKQFDIAKRKVDKINGEINALQRKMDDRKRKINKLKRTIKEKQERAKREVRKARAKVRSAENKVNSLLRRIRNLERKLRSEAITPLDSITIPHGKVYDQLHPQPTQLAMHTNFDQQMTQQHTLISNNELEQEEYIYQLSTNPYIAELSINHAQSQLVFFKKIGRAFKKAGKAVAKAAKKAAAFAKKQAMKVKWAAELVGLRTAHGIAWTSLKSAQGILKGAEHVAFDPTALKEAALITKEGTELAGLATGKGVLIASKESAKGILEAAKYTVKGVAEVVKFLAQKAGPPIEIQRAIFDCKLNDLKKGVLPALQIKARLFKRKTVDAKFQLDFKRPDKLVMSLIKLAIKVITP